MFARTKFSLISANSLPRENKILANKELHTLSFIDCRSTHSQIQRLSNDLEIENFGTYSDTCFNVNFSCTGSHSSL